MPQSKAEIIEERKANLPLPEDPPTASDWNSMDARNVNVGSGGVEGDISYGSGASSLRGPATGDSAVRTDGQQWLTNASGNDMGRTAKDNLGGLPNDAVTRDKKHHSATTDTTGQDYGYPQKSDPSSGLK